MMRTLVWLHRWLGVGIGLLMVAWCLSGIVMLYVPYPSLSEADRRAALQPLTFHQCCAWSAVATALGDSSPNALNIEMLGNRPVLRGRSSSGVQLMVDLRQGRALEGINDSDALRAALEFAPSLGSSGQPALVDRIDRDQWTVSSLFNADRPLLRYALNDESGTEVYVSSRTGKVVQKTASSERSWNYVGSVVHWLYPTLLRQNARLWSQVVIFAAGVGCVLTVAGLWIGVSAWIHRPAGRVSPYKGLNLWHHLPGLIFGPLLLVWVASGLISMNPGGLLVGDDGDKEIAALSDVQLDTAEMLRSLQRIASVAGDETRQIQFAPLAGHGNWLVHDKHTSERRAYVDAQPAALTPQELMRATSAIARGVAVQSAEYVPDDDAYFFSNHAAGVLPSGAWRIVLADREKTRLYLDGFDGHLLLKIDRNARWYQWLFSAPHQWNFSRSLRTRPLRDVVLLILLVGVSLVAVTGTWMAMRRIGVFKPTLK